MITKIVECISVHEKSKEFVQPEIRTIFNFFTQKLFQKPGLPLNVFNLIINFFSFGFDKIEYQFGLIFKETHIFDIIIKYNFENNQHLYKIDLEEYKRGARISQGGFGVFYKVTNKETNVLYAAKVIDCGDNQEACDKIISR